MDDAIPISYLNDFVFCPASIYFHQLYGSMDTMLFQDTDQINGTFVHEAIEEIRYSSKIDILQAISVYSSKYNIIGKIDIFEIDTGRLTERKRKIKNVYDGYVYQLYAQFFALAEMGYTVNSMRFYSSETNKVFPIKMPYEDHELFEKFEETVKAIQEFKLDNFKQNNKDKCAHCIYEPACDRSMLC